MAVDNSGRAAKLLIALAWRLALARRVLANLSWLPMFAARWLEDRQGLPSWATGPAACRVLAAQRPER